MPFYLTNENIEATVERNPDDVFHPDINQKPSSQNITIGQIISEEIKNTFETYLSKTLIENGLLCNENSLKDDICLSYLLKFESDDDEYEIVFYVPFELSVILEYYRQNCVTKIKNKIDEKVLDSNNKFFLFLSNSLVNCINIQDFSFLQNLKILGFSTQTNEYEKIKVQKNLYSYNISINKKEYVFYLQLDNQFNKIMGM